MLSRGTRSEAVADPRVEHRFAVILCADVVGYSRLMGLDEEGTLAALRTIRRDLVDPKIAEHRGHIVRTMGDRLLVEFNSIVDAVRCAIAIQRAMPEHTAEMPADRQIRFRFAINMGDVVSDGDLIYGDGVAVASRMEALAEPGGINVSRAVRPGSRSPADHVRGFRRARRQEHQPPGARLPRRAGRKGGPEFRSDHCLPKSSWRGNLIF